MKGFRKNSGIVLLNPETGKVFIGERFDTHGSWQMPQGGVERNESYKFAAKRELREEIGTGKFDIVKRTKQFYFYRFPKYVKNPILRHKYLGQKQLWFLAHFKGTDEDFKLNKRQREFINWRWETPENIVDIIIDFKKDIYISVFKEFGLLGDR